MIVRFFCALSLSLSLVFGQTLTEPIASPGLMELSSSSRRHTLRLDDGWLTISDPSRIDRHAGFESPSYDVTGWIRVDVPHNWDSYEGARQVKHGNRHGYAWYRRPFTVPAEAAGRRVFLFFEGVGSYATVWVNGRLVGRHAGGLTTFTLDITDAVAPGQEALVAVRADHPAGIRDLPWVCGGCERAYGFSEGTQPFGIFRPVHLVVTAPVRVAPFGVHVWNDRPEGDDPAKLAAQVRTELRNHGDGTRRVRLETALVDPAGTVLATAATEADVAAGTEQVLAQTLRPERAPELWFPDRPRLHTVVSRVVEGGSVVDETRTNFGFRWIEWPRPDGPPDQPFRINGRPFFINGVADYEHQLGANHAFSDQQVATRVAQVKAAGFNAFRDAHHPHNLRFQEAWDRDGVLWWTQFGTHIWFDNPAFRTNFQSALREWVRERRNSPSLVLWGLQNESKLPTAFAEACAAIIRELDPTASSQRKITTCNGGTGSDWNVPQNWTGTYGGDPLTYADDLRQQRLVGEYGAWRSLGLHTEGPFDAKGVLSEDRMAQLMETKIRLAESVRDQVAGHFMWPLTTHANPGRNIGEFAEQLGDGWRELEQVGPANNKGLFTLWGEPIDTFYLYRSNYAPKETEPMVYIVSHTWPDRWTAPGIRSGLVVYSNCDEVELFNDHGQTSLGTRTRGPRGTHFRWDNVPVNFNILHARGRVKGRVVATDTLRLHHLPAPATPAPREAVPDVLAPRPGRVYHWRINCGGPALTDRHGQSWLADLAFADTGRWGFHSWTDDYPHLQPAQSSLRALSIPIDGTEDDELLRTYRYGRHRLGWTLPVPDGDYEVDFFFVEPWYGVGGGWDARGWRSFDVAINGETRIRNLDIWAEAGHGRALKKTVAVTVTGGRLDVAFPRVASGQAVLSALAVSAAPGTAPAAPAPSGDGLIERLDAPGSTVVHGAYADTGQAAYACDNATTVAALPFELFGADWIALPAGYAGRNAEETLATFTTRRDADIFVAFDRTATALPGWLAGWSPANGEVATAGTGAANFALRRRALAAGQPLRLGGPRAGEAGPAAMYLVLVKARRPLALAQALLDLRSGDAGWNLVGNLRAGARPQADADIVFTSIPVNLTDSDWIQTTRARPPGTASFRVTDHMEIYAALDARIATPPAWLSGWVATDLKIATNATEGASFNLWRRRAAPDDTVEVGANGTLPDGQAAAMYMIVARPMRAVVAKDAAAATILGPGTRTDAGVVIEGGGSVEWTIEIGVGDHYDLNFTYHPAGPDKVAATLTMIAPDGKLLRSDPLGFPGGNPAIAQIARIRTSSSINAGTYRFRVTLPTGTRLRLTGLVVE